MSLKWDLARRRDVLKQVFRVVNSGTDTTATVPPVLVQGKPYLKAGSTALCAPVGVPPGLQLVDGTCTEVLKPDDALPGLVDVETGAVTWLSLYMTLTSAAKEPKSRVETCLSPVPVTKRVAATDSPVHMVHIQRRDQHGSVEKATLSVTLSRGTTLPFTLRIERAGHKSTAAGKPSEAGDVIITFRAPASREFCEPITSPKRRRPFTPMPAQKRRCFST